MLVGKELGPYLIEKELGSGAMGTVFLAKSKKSGERVAIKLMSLALGSSETAVHRFVREVAILKQLDHPNVVRYKGSGKYHGSPFYIMEYVEGESLDHILHRRTRLPWEEIIKIGIDLCAGLQHAHDKGIIHRDLKPSNLMILKTGVVKLTDFGIAKDTDVTALTAANSTVGTAAYMSPEQCRGARDITHKSDLYSMGIMFYELLTGKKPFVGETVMGVFMQHANSTKYKRANELVPEVPIWLNELVEQLMAKEAAKRPLNAKAVADALEHIQEKVARQRSAESEPTPKRKGEKSKGGKKSKEPEAPPLPPPKKKKPATQPFYTKGWFTILALLMIATLSSVCVYFAFLKTPDADALFNQAQTMMATDKKAAREMFADFLRYHPTHGKADKARDSMDDIDFETLAKQMHNRLNSPLKFTTTPEEDLFRKALAEEDDGKIQDAATRWEELSKKKGNKDADLHSWGLIGERYLKDIQKAKEEYKQLKSKIESKGKASDDLEQFALDARGKELAAEGLVMEDEAEAAKLFQQARSKWEDLQKAAKAESPRRWYLVATERVRTLRDAK